MSWGIDRVTVRFGPKVALEEVSIQADPGVVTAVVGGDGSGKTTALRALVGVLRPLRGKVKRPEDARIGYLPASSGVYPDLTVDENLAFAGAARGLDRHEISRRAGPLLERTGLAPFGERLGGRLSGGMRQKLGVILAVVHEPDLLVLDEPTTGIDPVSRIDLWRLIAEEAVRGAAVVLATSYLDEAERAADVVVLDQGRTLAKGAPSDVIASVTGSVLGADLRPDSPLRWRRGTGWRMWSPRGEAPSGASPVSPDLTDAVVVAALSRAQEAAS